MLEIRKDYAQAERFYRQCTELKPDCAMAWVGLAALSVELHKLAESVAAYMEAVRLSAHRRDLLRPRANALPSKSLRCVPRCRSSLHPAEPELTLAHRHAGRALLKFGALSDALKVYEAALAVDPKCVEAMVGFAENFRPVLPAGGVPRLVRSRAGSASPIVRAPTPASCSLSPREARRHTGRFSRLIRDGR